MAYPQQYLGDAASLLPKNIGSFLFVRHGRTDWNVKQIAQGSADIPLNEEGERQAREVCSVLLKQPIERVITSPLSRARRTAELASEGLSVEIVGEDGLKERGFGKHEGTVAAAEMYIGDYDDCETTQDFSRRIAKALVHCTKEGTLLVAHGGVLSVILALLKADLEEKYLGNACVLRFQQVNGQWELTALTSDDH